MDASSINVGVFGSGICAGTFAGDCALLTTPGCGVMGDDSWLVDEDRLGCRKTVDFVASGDEARRGDKDGETAGVSKEELEGLHFSSVSGSSISSIELVLAA